MEDLHTHLLYGIDDGSKTIEESIAILRQMERNGIEEIVLTPHYIEGSKYNCNNYNKVKIYQQLMEKAESVGIKIRIYLGNEVFITPDLLRLLNDGEVASINNSRYLMISFPIKKIYSNTGFIINELVNKGYIPILSHPEKYEAFQENPDRLEDFLKMGVLVQCNFTSLYGDSGKRAKKALKYFLKKRWVSFLGSDTHHEYDYPVSDVKKKLMRITKDKIYVKELTYSNFDRVINDEEIEMIR